MIDSYFAFPSGDFTRVQPESGLSKRELFAAMALQGLLACPNTSGSPSAFALDAVKHADALIAHLAGDSSEKK